MARIKTSLIIDSELHKKIKIYCIKKEIDMSDYFEDLIKRDSRLQFDVNDKTPKKAA